MNDEFHHECCPTCGNEDIFMVLDDGNLLCGNCMGVLEVQTLEESRQ